MANLNLADLDLLFCSTSCFDGLKTLFLYSSNRINFGNSQFEHWVAKLLEELEEQQTAQTEATEGQGLFD